MIEVMKKRYTILRHIRDSGAVGRRALAAALQMTERVLRAETEFLRLQGLIETEASGMRISEAGVELLNDLAPMLREWLGLAELEEQIAKRFALRQVVVVPGDADSETMARSELGKAGAAALAKAAAAMERESGKPLVIAITGGSTVGAVAEHLAPAPAFKSALFVPARGGLGARVETQSGTIASTMARRTGGGYRLMHLPENIGEEALTTLLSEPHIREVAELLNEARIAVHGIGEAYVMAGRRRADAETLRLLERDGAVAESFGCYFNRSGEVVHRTPSFGLKLEQIRGMETVIAVAGGASKAGAIAAVLRSGHEDVLIVDEAAAQAIVRET